MMGEKDLFYNKYILWPLFKTFVIPFYKGTENILGDYKYNNKNLKLVKWLIKLSYPKMGLKEAWQDRIKPATRKK